MRKAGQGMTCMVQVRVTHGRVFAHDVHASHLVRIAVRRQGLLHDFDHGVTRVFVQLGIPELLKPVVGRTVVDPLVVRVHHRNQTRITCALHIVLTTQGV